MAYERAESPEKQRIIQELVPGKQVTLAHVIASPDRIIYQKLGLDPEADYRQAAIGILSMSPAEIAVIAGDLALKTASVEMGFIDRFSGTLIFTGLISDVEAAHPQHPRLPGGDAGVYRLRGDPDVTE